MEAESGDAPLAGLFAYLWNLSSEARVERNMSPDVGTPETPA